MSQNQVLFLLIVIYWLCSMVESGVVAPKRQLGSHITDEYKNSQMTNSISEVDCSQFSNDYDVLRQFPFPVLMNPTDLTLNQSTATMDKDNTFVRLIYIQDDILPLSVFCLSKLEQLTINTTPFPNGIVPDALAKLKQLKLLWIFDSPIVKMTEQLRTLDNLVDLFLSNCSLTHMPNLSNLKQLRYLSLPGNRLSQLDGLLNVSTMDLENNLFNEIPTIKNAENVADLYMSNNSLKNAVPITSYINLKRIDLRNTTLTFIPPNIDKLQKLICLYLSNNKLSHLPTNIFNLPNLEYLAIKNNLFSPNDIKSIPKKFKKSYPNAELLI